MLSRRWTFSVSKDLLLQLSFWVTLKPKCKLYTQDGFLPWHFSFLTLEALIQHHSKDWLNLVQCSYAKPWKGFYSPLRTFWESRWHRTDQWGVKSKKKKCNFMQIRRQVALKLCSNLPKNCWGKVMQQRDRKFSLFMWGQMCVKEKLTIVVLGSLSCMSFTSNNTVDYN